jgi:hypothetical protein
MAKYAIWLVVVLLMGGCATYKPAEKIPADRSVAVISAFHPEMRGYRPGITVFGNEEWSAENSGFEINAKVLDAIRANTSREVKLVNGEKMQLVPEKEEKDVSEKMVIEELAKKLARLGEEWRTDMIVVILGGAYQDWIGKGPQILRGFGFYKQARIKAVYWVPAVVMFDCKTGKFTGSGTILDAQRLPDIGWRKNWSDFTSGQQHAVRRELDALINADMPDLLFALGLSDKHSDVHERSFISRIFVPGADLRPSLTKGNQLQIPPGTPAAVVHMAIEAGFKAREWTLTENTDEKIVGSYRNGKNEAICTVTFKDGSIALATEGYETQSDGKRVPKDHQRWQNNLKDSILDELMVAGTRPPPGNVLEVLPGISKAVAHQSVVAGFKDRNWIVNIDSDERVSGTYRSGKKEAVCTVLFKDRSIVLEPEGYEIQSDGKRVATEYRRWQNNLKESIFGELLEAQTDIAL